MYLLACGVVHEAAASGRRALEYIGMASHLVRHPGKAKSLCAEEAKSSEFKKAFIRGADLDEARKLKQAGIAYCFAGMGSGQARAATRLYEIFSRFNVHGGTMSSLVGIALSPTANSTPTNLTEIRSQLISLLIWYTMHQAIAT
jgi:hypothetical protein